MSTALSDSRNAKQYPMSFQIRASSFESRLTIICRNVNQRAGTQQRPFGLVRSQMGQEQVTPLLDGPLRSLTEMMFLVAVNIVFAELGKTMQGEMKLGDLSTSCRSKSCIKQKNKK